MNRIIIVVALLAVFLMGAIGGIVATRFGYLPYVYIAGISDAADLIIDPRGEQIDYELFFGELDSGDKTGTDDLFTIKDEPYLYNSPLLEAKITVLPGVFNPLEAERAMFPIMEHNAGLFEGSTVMEIGTGSGMIALYAAKLGASKVVATDINPAALESTRMNAAALGFADVIDARLVPPSDMSAYSVIAPDEQFDVIISNPPFALDLDSPGNNALTDSGDLGFSIVRGLEDHLKPGGTVILLYDSLFYHQVMVKFARHSGYAVRNHSPNGLYPWAAESLFNSYLKRLLASEGLDTDAFRFDFRKGDGLEIQYLRNFGLRAADMEFEPLFPGPKAWRYYAGMIVIEKS